MTQFVITSRSLSQCVAKHTYTHFICVDSLLDQPSVSLYSKCLCLGYKTCLGLTCRNLWERVSVLTYSCSAFLHLENEKVAGSTAVMQQQNGCFSWQLPHFVQFSCTLKRQYSIAVQYSSWRHVSLCFVLHVSLDAQLLSHEKYTNIDTVDPQSSLLKRFFFNGS